MTEADDLRAVQLERIARLQARRSAATTADTAGPSAQTEKRRRRHAAPGGRIAAAGLGATTMLGIVAAFGVAARSTSADTPPTTVPAPEPSIVASPIQVVIHRVPATAPKNGSPTTDTVVDTAPAEAADEPTAPIELTATPVIETVTVTRRAPHATELELRAVTDSRAGTGTRRHDEREFVMSEVVEHRLRVMASTTQIVLVAPRPQAVLDAEARLRELERRWSRFVDTSDITRLNQSGGAWVRVSDDTVRLVETMQHASRLSDGAFDPTFLHELLSVGYAASIDDPDRITIAVDVPSRDHTVHDVEFDRSASQLRVPPGLSLDPGGIGKGLAADLVVTELLAAGTAGALVSIGGDLAAAGRAPNEAGWSIVVEDPIAPPDAVAAFTVSAGGVATSSTRSRRWMHQGAEVHHVIDPRTGGPSTTDLASVTVVATAGWSAEVHATAALMRGTSGAVPYLVERGLNGLAVSLDGTMRSTPVFDASASAGVAT